MNSGEKKRDCRNLSNISRWHALACIELKGFRLNDLFHCAPPKVCTDYVGAGAGVAQCSGIETSGCHLLRHKCHIQADHRGLTSTCASLISGVRTINLDCADRAQRRSQIYKYGDPTSSFAIWLSYCFISSRHHAWFDSTNDLVVCAIIPY